MMTQPELFAPRKRTADQAEADARDLAELLRGRGPLLAREIEALRPEWADPEHRYVRRLAALSPAIVSGPGVMGYALAAECDLDALREIAARRAAQIRAEGRELVRIRRIIGLRMAEKALTERTAA